MVTEHVFLEQILDRMMSPDPDLRKLTAVQQYEAIMAKVSDLPEPVISPDDLLERLTVSKKQDRPLTVKFGIDPTGPEIHVGHAVPLINLRLFQRLGHKVILVIGDFTGMIGDPSGRVDARPALTEEDMASNMATYEDQASRIIDLRDPSIERHYNSSWMKKLSLRQWVELLKRVSVSSLLQREDFRARLAAGHGLSMAELEYALFMGYDSVALNPDIEIGGVDQFLNMHICRQMMTIAGQKPEIIVSYNLLAGTTGERDEQGRLTKMSKSRGNYIPVTADPADMYGKVMSIPDEVMWFWYRELTEITSEELETLKDLVVRGKVHPKVAKQLLARVIVGTFNHFDVKTVRAAEDDFDQKFGKQSVLVPESTQTIRVDGGEMLVDLLARLTDKSKSEIRRLAQQEGVRVLIKTEYVSVTMAQMASPASELGGHVLRIGKREYFRLEM